MLRWSLKNLFAEPLRLVFSAVAVAISFILVIFFDAVFEGESEQMVIYIEQMEADVWVMQKGVSNMHMASSLLWDWKADMVAKVPGVREVSSILYLNAAVKAGGRDWFSYIIGLPPDPQYGGPWDMAEGKPGPAAGEAVIPEVIAQLAGLKLGDTLTIIDKQLVIVGLTRGTFSMSSAVVFVSREDLGDLMEAEDQISYIMVKAQPGISQTVLATRIKEEVEKVNALPNEALIASDRQMALQMGAEIVHMMTVIGTLLAMMIVAFTAYSQTAHKQRELAIAKALGFRNPQLYAAALCQTLVITVIGYLAAVLIAYTLLPLLPELAPQITLSVTPQTLLSLGAVVLPVAILACLGPVIKVARVDPMTVFQR
jgi:ABC-type antimicrobial peptide transport system permease subunit